ncbi:MAG: hypothetical protein U0798_08165 [Gemmataceae bacterium]
MGFERTVASPGGVKPSWERVSQSLRNEGESPVLRMIDGLPAFPDEQPAENWTELRVGLSGGMVTIRWKAGTVSCVSWGTQDAGLSASFERVVRACEQAVSVS